MIVNTNDWMSLFHVVINTFIINTSCVGYLINTTVTLVLFIWKVFGSFADNK